MYALATSNFLRRSLLVNEQGGIRFMKADPTKRSERIKRELESLGVSPYGLLKMESRYLPYVIRENEHIMAIIYGRYGGGTGMLVATDRRIIFLDKRPLFMDEEEETYDGVRGIGSAQTSFGKRITLHMTTRDYVIHTLNEKCADDFVGYIESRCLLRSPGSRS